MLVHTAAEREKKLKLNVSQREKVKREKGETEAGELRSEKVKREKGESEPAGVSGSVKVRFRQTFRKANYANEYFS